MPKAKPLPEDPIEREKVLKRRRQTLKAVTVWRLRHPEQARLYTQTAWRRWNIRQAGKRALAAFKAQRVTA